jgi:tRNA (cytosine38-C5)-methyltransferase
MQRKPSFLLIENVKGFESSQTRGIAVDVLKHLKYHHREFLLSPLQIGIPNSRLRYYLIARLERAFSFGEDDAVIETIPSVLYSSSCTKCPVNRLICGEIDSEKRKLQSFLLQDVEHSFFLTDKQLQYTQGLDIVTRNSISTCCFTRGYGHLLLGTGSVLQVNDKLDVHQLMLQVGDLNEAERMVRLKELGLRFFTPQEVANLMCFPSVFRFPDHITSRQKYRLLGNSVNVDVISLMLQFLLFT